MTTVKYLLYKLLTDIPVNSKVLKNLEIKVLDSITRTLSFYGSQLDEISTADTALTLKMLKGKQRLAFLPSKTFTIILSILVSTLDIDDKHGKILQKNFPVNQWIQSNCEANSNEEKFCKSLIRQWKNRSAGKSMANMEYWKPAFVLQNQLNQIDDETLENIGEEKEGLWGKLNGECQEALVNRCEIPYICERTLLDPTPRSQYLLTHQLFQRLILDNTDCPNLRSLVTEEETYAKFCTKAYMEAQYLDLLNVPINHRDLFAELGEF